jgi:hypothetical protein
VIFIYLFFIFHFSFFILMEHFQTFNLGVLDLGAITWSKARWSVIADQIMLRQKKYSNPFRELTIDGVEGFPLGDINPDFGIFSSTAALEKGEQLQTLYTKIRNAYQILLARLDKSGFHSAHDELVKAALERTGEGRMKDIPLFFYYMTVRNTDLKFLDSTLQKDENGEEVNIEKEPVNLSEYSKRKLAIKEKESNRRNVADERQIAFLKSVMSPDGASKDVLPTAAVNDSIIAKNNATIRREEKNSAYLTSMTKTEETRNIIMEIDSIKNTLKDPEKENYLSPEDIDDLKFRLRELMGLPKR